MQIPNDATLLRIFIGENDKEFIFNSGRFHVEMIHYAGRQSAGR